MIQARRLHGLLLLAQWEGAREEGRGGKATSVGGRGGESHLA